MKIFNVKVDLNCSQLIMPVEDTDEISDLLIFDGKTKSSSWRPLEFYIYDPANSKSNFYSLIHSGAFACDNKAIDSLYLFFGFGSELLPIFLEDGTELFILNVTDCINALDQKKSEFDLYDNGERGRILKYSFHRDRFSESSIFKIPETSKTEILTYSGVKSEEDEFYSKYLQTDLRGLTFEEIYSE